MPRSVLVPLPDRGFDVTEVAVPWKLLTQSGVDVEDGHYVSARWPGDSYLFAERFGDLLAAAARSKSSAEG